MDMESTRRSFIAGSTVLAAGALLGAAGVRSGNSLRKHGPVKLWTKLDFLSKEPMDIDGAIFVDDHRGVFGIFVVNQGRPEGKEKILEASLVDLRSVVDSGAGKTVCLCFGPEQQLVQRPAAIVSEDGKITFLIDFGNNDVFPLWLAKTDILKVL